MIVQPFADAFDAVGGTNPEGSINACVVAVSLLLRDDTRRVAEEFLDLPWPQFRGRTARQMIADGKADELASELWALVEAPTA